MRFSALKILTEGLSGNKGWAPHWRNPEPKAEYDAIIIGGGGHGLSTAYYLAKNHGLTNIAVLEKGYLGGGNIGRNTTIVRANYFLPGNSEFYSHSLKLWEGLEDELNFNVMHSQRGIINLFHSDGARDAAARRGNAMINQGDDAILLDRDGVRKLLPYLNYEQERFPIYGGLYHKRGGTARHDAVAWGYARACSAMGMDIIQNCAVTGIETEGGAVKAVTTTKGRIETGKLALVVAGHSSELAAMAGFRLPIESVALQALVSEPIEPCMDVVVMANTVHGYLSQSDKGEMVIGGGTDGFNNYTQRGSFHHVEETVRALVETFPMLSRLRMLRQWGGIVDMTGDRSPILSKTPVGGIYVNAGWGTGGFKAIPGSGWAMADLVAKDAPGPLAADFGLDRFREGRFIDESVAAGVAH